MKSMTEAQTRAISCVERNLQIIACAGSGKTEVIAQRIATLVDLPGVTPANIVAFTFTDKAAAELKDRVITRITERRGDAHGLAEMFIGTMHAYCLELLHRHVPETFRFNVLTEVTNRLLIDRNSVKSGLTSCPTSSAGTPFLKRWVNSRLFMQVTSILREDTVDEPLVPDGVSRALASYIGLLGQRSYLDYTEILNLVVQLLEEADDDAGAMLRSHVWGDLKYLVVDEYQDCNPLQERLIASLVSQGANLCVVGDDDQTIYQWRGSELGNILTFATRYTDVEQITLGENFRSSPGILAVGRTVAESIPPVHRLPKVMAATGHQTWERGDILALDFLDEQAEAAWICDRIAELHGAGFSDTPTSAPRGLSWSDCAVLFRSVSHDAQPLADELKRRDIPYVIKGLNRLFDSDEITAVVGIFGYLVGEEDRAGLQALWEAARLVPAGTDWRAAFKVLDIGKDFSRGSRWGTYNIQRLFLDFLEALGVREDAIPGSTGRGELVFYQLGKFSQVISDYEEIHFASSPEQKYDGFRRWLRHQAPEYYADSDAADKGYAAPDAVTIATVHQAKGMQWPAVFVPCLRANRFPSKASGGLNVFHVIPAEAVRDPQRYRGGVEDETRLFYVAVTRAQKYLAMTYSPGKSRLFTRRSAFMNLVDSVQYVSTKASVLGADIPRLPPVSRHEVPQVTLSFSELKYFFECPYQFKLRFLYGFNPPIHEALGYGKGLHDALAEVHKRALDGDFLNADAATELVDRHLHTPYAYPDLRRDLEQSARSAIERYFLRHGAEIPNTVHSEKQIQVNLGGGIVVDGRIDLIRRLDTGEVSVVDFKSTDRAQPEEVTRDQLHVYALGYQELSGTSPDLIEVMNLDDGGKSTREEVEMSVLEEVRQRVLDAGDALRTNTLNKLDHWCGHCDTCDLAALCRTR